MVALKAPLALALLLLSAFGIAHASGTAQAWTIDPAQSQVRFVVRKFWFAHVRGTFPALSGTLHRIDTHIGADLGRVDADLAVAGLQMDNADDRERALGTGFFDAAQFPAIHFRGELGAGDKFDAGLFARNGGARAAFNGVMVGQG